MQFRSAGHVLGFTPEGVLVAGRDHLLKVNFVGAVAVAPEARPASENGDPAQSDQAPVATGQGVAPLHEVHYRNLWPGIDLRYDAKDGIARSTYTLAPGAKVEDIRLSYNVPIEITSEGNLTLTYATGTLHESAPIAWQEIEGKHTPVQAAFHKHANGELSFTLGDYNSALPLTIDPTLTWNTFLGGDGGTDIGRGIATDTAGNVYVIGDSDFTWGAPVRAYTGPPGYDAFVARLDAATGELTWNTFLGSGGDDRGYGIATDTVGNVYVTGESDTDWGAPVRPFTVGFDAFVARLSGATGELTWNTFLGGTGYDTGRGIATDAAGNVYVTGWSFATWGVVPVLPYTAGADAFVARLSAAGELTWNTFLGAGGGDIGYGIATDTAGVYVTGVSTATWGVAPVLSYTAADDAFVARLAAATGVLTWNTFLGGAGFDEGRGIATDAAGNVYVTGQSDVTWGAPVRAHTGVGGYDAFAARLAAATGVLTWNTFLGGAGIGGPGAPGFDTGRGIATDAAGNVYVTGYSNVTWGAPARAYSGGSDAFAARLDAATGALGSNTFLGAIGTDIGHGIATDAAGNVYVTGQSEATWGGPVRAYSGAGTDAFVARLEGVDTTPDAFTFTAQTGVALSSVATSNTITVSGINTAAPISIVGGTYSINGGAYTAAAGTVNNGDTVTLRQTSSASFNTLTTATLTIGGVSGAFDVTTLAADTTPDAFTFTAQTGVALSSVATSNTITVSGINTAAPISIVGGTYSINGGAYTAAAGTVNNGDTVTLRQTSSASFNTLTTATLTIGGVSAVFDVTTLAAPPPSACYSAPSATGSGTITACFTGGGPTCTYSAPQFIAAPPGAAPIPPTTPGPGIVFPHGLFDFSTTACTAGGTLSFTISYPTALPPGTVYWKYGPSPSNATPNWYVLPATIAGNTATFTITDGGLGDDDLSPNGGIVDQGGPGAPASVVPTLSEWAMLTLVLLLGWLGVRQMYRTRRLGAPARPSR